MIRTVWLVASPCCSAQVSPSTNPQPSAWVPCTTNFTETSLLILTPLGTKSGSNLLPWSLDPRPSWWLAADVDDSWFVFVSIGEKHHVFLGIVHHPSDKQFLNKHQIQQFTVISCLFGRWRLQFKVLVFIAACRASFPGPFEDHCLGTAWLHVPGQCPNWTQQIALDSGLVFLTNYEVTDDLGRTLLGLSLIELVFTCQCKVCLTKPLLTWRQLSTFDDLDLELFFLWSCTTRYCKASMANISGFYCETGLLTS